MDLKTTLSNLGKAVRSCLTSPRWRKLRLLFGAIIALAAMVGVGRQLVQGAGAIQWRYLSSDWPTLVVAVAWVIVSQLMGGLVWRLMLAGLGYGPSLAACTVIHATSAMAKYVPGYAWQLAGKAYLTSKRDVPPKVVTIALAAEFAGLLLTALMVTALLWPYLDPAPASLPSLVLPVAFAFACLVLAAAPWLMRQAGRHVGIENQRATRAWPIWCAFGIMLVAWLILGESTRLTVKATTGPKIGLWVPSMVSIALSFVVSLLVFVVPGGIGIRESMLTALLAPWIGSGPAAMVAVLSRLTLTAGELLTFGVVWLAKAAVAIHNRSITQRGDVSDE